MPPVTPERATRIDETAPVLIVGGGYAGLAAALLLAHHGVASLLVDKHPDVSVQGRARGINQRTMEIYRALGLAERIVAAGRPFDSEAGVVRCSSIAGEWTWLLDDDTRGPLPELTPCQFGMADQRSVEPILIDAARAQGADIRFNTQCAALRADDDGVTAVITDRATGASRTVRADYVIAADGFRGGIGPGQGIGRSGPGVTQHWVTFVVAADLAEIVPKRALFWIVLNDEIGFGSFLTTSVADQWAISVGYDPARESAADFTPDRCRQVAAAVLGRDDIPVEIIDVAAWEEAAGVADRFRDGRVLLVGDSAHVWPPAGAMGANAAVQDAHNLAWKLAGVLGGWAGDRLLDTYQAERRPVATTLADLTVRRQQARFSGATDPDDIDDVLCTLGQRYTSAAVIGAEHETVYPDKLEPRAVPGMRAPHLWLDQDGTRVALHDLCHDAFVVLTGAHGQRWGEVAERVATRLGVPLRSYRVGGAGADLVDVDDAWLSRYEVGTDGCVLIRPDGYLAWHCPTAEAEAEPLLGDVLARTLCLGR